MLDRRRSEGRLVALAVLLPAIALSGAPDVDAGPSLLLPRASASTADAAEDLVDSEEARAAPRRQGTATRRRPRPRPTSPAPAEPQAAPAVQEAAPAEPEATPEPVSPPEEARAEAEPSAPRPRGTATRTRPRPWPVAPSVAEPQAGLGTLPAAEPGSPAAGPEPPAAPEEARAAGYGEALEAYYSAIREKNRADQATFARLADYDAWALENRKRVIERQQTAAWIILAVVVFLVLCGVAFSAIQFYIAMRHAQRGEAAPATTLKASLSSIEVSSSVLGVIVLVISLLFFYLYLDRVFSLAILPD